MEPTKEQYAEWLQRYSQQYGVDPAEVAAIFEVESTSGENVKTSGKGARGPMQLVPKTGWAHAKQIAGLSDDADIDDPETNIHAGVAYYSYLSDHTDSAAEAAMAYNSGLEGLKRQQESGQLYPETEQYAKKFGIALQRARQIPEIAGPAATGPGPQQEVIGQPTISTNMMGGTPGGGASPGLFSPAPHALPGSAGVEFNPALQGVQGAAGIQKAPFQPEPGGAREGEVSPAGIVGPQTAVPLGGEPSRVGPGGVVMGGGGAASPPERSIDAILRDLKEAYGDVPELGVPDPRVYGPGTGFGDPRLQKRARRDMMIQSIGEMLLAWSALQMGKRAPAGFAQMAFGKQGDARKEYRAREDETEQRRLAFATAQEKAQYEREKNEQSGKVGALAVELEATQKELAEDRQDERFETSLLMQQVQSLDQRVRTEESTLDDLRRTRMTGYRDAGNQLLREQSNLATLRNQADERFQKTRKAEDEAKVKEIDAMLERNSMQQAYIQALTQDPYAKGPDGEFLDAAGVGREMEQGALVSAVRERSIQAQNSLGERINPEQEPIPYRRSLSETESILERLAAMAGAEEAGTTPAETEPESTETVPTITATKKPADTGLVTTPQGRQVQSERSQAMTAVEGLTWYPTAANDRRQLTMLITGKHEGGMETDPASRATAKEQLVKRWAPKIPGFADLTPTQMAIAIEQYQETLRQKAPKASYTPSRN